ncbi:GNAT family N-acetyltransferase [Magnetococcus sp. PR-3]|uniref:GNAT family N-acetyltransferase n=1 Tax=Magnetococcus sp. PR-3 TaxID=3120355 RepID=UPI002FCE02A9
MHTRLFKTSDATALCEIFQQAVLQLGPSYYNTEQVRIWVNRTPTPQAMAQRMSDGRFVRVAVDDQNNPIGFMDLEQDGHIDLCYIHPDWARRGVGSTLLHEIEQFALHAHYPKLYSEVSEVGKPFFLRRSFKCLHTRHLCIDGINIHNYALEKPLTPS